MPISPPNWYAAEVEADREETEEVEADMEAEGEMEVDEEEEGEEKEEKEKEKEEGGRSDEVEVSRRSGPEWEKWKDIAEAADNSKAGGRFGEKSTKSFSQKSSSVERA